MCYLCTAGLNLRPVTYNVRPDGMSEWRVTLSLTRPTALDYNAEHASG